MNWRTARGLVRRRKLKWCGSGLEVGRHVTITEPEKVSIGSFVSLNDRVYIQGVGGVNIGNCVRIAHGVSIISTNHIFEDPRRPIMYQGHRPAPISIGNDVWIGCKAVILAGVNVGPHSVVGAASVVTKDVEPWTVVAGNPATVIKRRDEG